VIRSLAAVVLRRGQFRAVSYVQQNVQQFFSNEPSNKMC
jgi:hypothetical protein